jgi:hypothetical protein
VLTKVSNNVFILHNKLPDMKKVLLFTFIGSLFCSESFSQSLLPSPRFISHSSSNASISVEATKDKRALLIYTPTSGVDVHIGEITNKSSNSSDLVNLKLTWSAAQYPIFNQPLYKYKFTWQYK